jgi:anti-anti-sigma regulatory factor
MVAITRIEKTDAHAGVLVVEFDEGESIPRTLATLDPHESSDIALDFSQIEKINSADLSALIVFCVKMRSEQKKVILENVPPMIHELFDLTRFSRLADIHRHAPAPESPARFAFFSRRR